MSIKFQKSGVYTSVLKWVSKFWVRKWNTTRVDMPWMKGLTWLKNIDCRWHCFPNTLMFYTKSDEIPSLDYFPLYAIEYGRHNLNT